MAIETYLGEQDINIKDLQIKQPEGDPSGLSFDMEKEVSPEDVEWLKSEFNTMISNGFYNPETVGLALALKYLLKDNSDFMNRLRGDWPKFKKGFDDIFKKGLDNINSTSEWALWGANLKLLFPDECKGFLDLEQNWQTCLDALSSTKQHNLMGAITLGGNIKIIFPNKNINSLFTPQEIQILTNEVKDLMKTSDKIKGNTSSILSKFKILFPSEFGKLNSPKEVKTKIISFLNAVGREAEQSVPNLYARQAREMVILSADQAQVTEAGLELTKKKPTKLTEQHPLPETKKF